MITNVQSGGTGRRGSFRPLRAPSRSLWVSSRVSWQNFMTLTSYQFAKHMKVDEQTKFLQSQRTGIAVGTPARLMALVDNGTLHNHFTFYWWWRSDSMAQARCLWPSWIVL